jgi:hypothetical protein
MLGKVQQCRLPKLAKVLSDTPGFATLLDLYWGQKNVYFTDLFSGIQMTFILQFQCPWWG